MGIFSKQGPQQIEVSGHQLVCPVCSNTHFYFKKAQLNSSVSTFFNLDWTDKSASCFVCSECTHISWFLGQ